MEILCFALPSLAFAGSVGCSSALDCSMAGLCTNGVCECVTGFHGPKCSALQLMAYKCGSGGLCVKNGSATWGGSVVEADDGSWHMYAAMMADNATLQKWLTKSVVLHAVAPKGSPQGPYIPADVALAPRPGKFDDQMIHNPDAKRLPVPLSDGSTWAIWYDGTGKAKPGEDPHSTQRIGLATASSPFGPWTRYDDPVLSPSGLNGTWDKNFVTNPGPFVFPNGSVLLVYKAAGKAPGFQKMNQGIAYSETGARGPYEKVTSETKPLALPGNCEDPGVYYDSTPGLEVFRMILHCGCATQLMWSVDGIEWKESGPQQTSGWCRGFNYSDGTAGMLATRQRPKWITDPKTGQALYLTTGVNRPGDGGMGHVWTMAAKLV